MTKRRILVVDDEDAMRAEIGSLLAEEGFACELAASGEAALKLIRGELKAHSHEDGIFDCVVLDQDMPGMNGFETLEAIRGLDCMDPAIMLTGHVSPQAFVKADEDAMDGFLAKSEIDRLAPTVRRLVESPSLLADDRELHRALGFAADARVAHDAGKKAFYWRLSAQQFEHLRRWELAAVHHEKAGDIFLPRPDPGLAADSYRAAGEAYQKCGKHKKAQELKEKARKLCECKT